MPANCGGYAFYIMVLPMPKGATVMRSTSSVPLMLWIFTMLCGAHSARAQITPAQPQAVQQSQETCQESDESTKLYELGIELLGRDLNRAALDAFQRSYDLSHCMQALAQIAFAERGLRRWVDAAEHLRIALASSDPWIEQHRAQFQQEQMIIEQRREQAGGRNEDPEIIKPAPSPTPPRIRAGWGLSIIGVLLGGAGAATLSVAQAFGRSVNGIDFGMWDNGNTVYGSAIPAGGALVAIGGAALMTGVTLLLLPPKEQPPKHVRAGLAPSASGLVLGGGF